MSILYLRLPESFNIILRGRVVEPHIIANDLKFPEFILYRPQCGGCVEVVLNFCQLLSYLFTRLVFVKIHCIKCLFVLEGNPVFILCQLVCLSPFKKKKKKDKHNTHNNMEYNVTSLHPLLIIFFFI